MATHEALIPIGLPQGGFCRIGDLLNYDGPPDWKMRPLDPTARKDWESEVADPERIQNSMERLPEALRTVSDRPETHDYLTGEK